MQITLPTDADPARLIHGDALDVLRQMPDGCVQTCITSPPYYGLRDYGHAGQIGLEPTPAGYVARLVAVFEEVRRVLRDDGTLWLNLGDSYNSAASNQNGRGLDDKVRGGNRERGRNSAIWDGAKVKDLLGIPWRVAFALQDAGWTLRQDIIWAKPNPMPESVRDRCTKAHEYLFLLSKSARYFFDAEAIREPAKCSARPESSRWKDEGSKLSGTMSTKTGLGFNKPEDGANKRSVWTVTPDPYPGAHFAVMPPELVRPCVLAGSKVGGIVLDPFAGSGTTLAVAVEEKRLAVGVELNPAYLALARKRVTGMTPRLFASTS
jgi:DNA modification methylase